MRIDTVAQAYLDRLDWEVESLSDKSVPDVETQRPFRIKTCGG